MTPDCSTGFFDIEAARKAARSRALLRRQRYADIAVATVVALATAASAIAVLAVRVLS